MSNTAATPLDPMRHFLVTVAVMLAVLMQVLDTTIANVALPHMQASLSATSESINWVLTSYIVASAIAIPIAGWLAERIGRRRLLLMAVVGFTVASMLCAIATSLPEMVAFRILQGVSGAFLVPLAQATMFDINPPAKHAQAMALFGGGIMIGPILGPVLGGWLTDSFDWRWVFIVNLPVGVLATFMLWRTMPESPTNRRPFDLVGFALLAVALGALQMFLDRGESQDWFQSWEIWIEMGLAIAFFWMFVIHTLTARAPIFEKGMFADRNFATGLLFMAVTGVLLLAGLALLPPLLQRLYGYSVLQSGILTAPRGVGTLISMLVAGRLVGKFDSRLLVVAGISFMATSLWMMTGFALDQPAGPVIWSGVVQGLGIGLIFVVMQSLAFATLAPQLRTAAASLLNLSRNIGGSVGIAIVGSQLVRMTQVAHADIASNVTASTIPTLDPGLLERIGQEGDVALAVINAEVTRQALFIAYLDDFYLMMWVTLAAIPLVLLLRKAKAGGGAPAHAIAD
ncbi:DHA2 family efflux MFS transporter permease subunit [Sphingomonas astaxanthinifaciens]|uniref:EmrB/QacA family drug resistance transporter n=1 Tax=Sphingomonas astaxanthinifaciens DSM 22298 TaxID=1123267 RepID=A0ABQ5Z4M4_9SPHN|nr:DHA2 family efflux MFS transporter permease subunit [Sphingomonas astaxanthinifaciens]GLR46306.1 EmrB/QacA family drug resistance transporter [Sphingomonas astaxanthinifaciens DSM 22298]